MNNNWVFLAYYLYAVSVVCIFSYAVFGLDKSGWYWVLALIMLNISPTITTKKDKDEEVN